MSIAPSPLADAATAVMLAVLLVADELLFLFGRDLVEQFTQKPLPAWLPVQVIRLVSSRILPSGPDFCPKILKYNVIGATFRN